MTTTATLVEIALDAAAEAALATLDSRGGDRGDCGHAFVVLTARKGRKALVAALAANNICTGRHHTGGVSIHILAGLRAQTRLPYEKGCRAFVDTLKAAGYAAHVYSFAD